MCAVIFGVFHTFVAQSQATKNPPSALAEHSVDQLKNHSLFFAANQSPRACSMEQSRNNARAKSLCFPASARKHCSIDLRFSFARRAR